MRSRYIVYVIQYSESRSLTFNLGSTFNRISSLQFLCEPCLYEVAGLLPTMDATNAVAVGTGFSGVLNWAVKVIIMLGAAGIAGTDIPLSTAQSSQAAFIAFLSFSSATTLLFFPRARGTRLEGCWGNFGNDGLADKHKAWSVDMEPSMQGTTRWEILWECTAIYRLGEQKERGGTSLPADRDSVVVRST